MPNDVVVTNRRKKNSTSATAPGRIHFLSLCLFEGGRGVYPVSIQCFGIDFGHCHTADGNTPQRSKKIVCFVCEGGTKSRRPAGHHHRMRPSTAPRRPPSGATPGGGVHFATAEDSSQLPAITTDAPPVPPGWRDVSPLHRSNTRGAHFYIGPAGPTWQHPAAPPRQGADFPSPALPPAVVAGSASSSSVGRHDPAARKPPQPIATMYMCDFRPCDLASSLEQRRELLTTFSPSQRPHPKGAVATQHLESLAHHDFKDPRVAASATAAPTTTGGSLPKPPLTARPSTATRGGEILPIKAALTNLRGTVAAVAVEDSTPVELDSEYRVNYTIHAKGVERYRRPYECHVTQAPTAFTSTSRSAFATPSVKDARKCRLDSARGRDAQRRKADGSQPLHQNGADGDAWKTLLLAHRPATDGGGAAADGSSGRSSAQVSCEAFRTRRRTQYDVERGWRHGRNPATEEQFVTLYKADFIDIDQREGESRQRLIQRQSGMGGSGSSQDGASPAHQRHKALLLHGLHSADELTPEHHLSVGAMLSTSRAVDRSIVERSKLNEELSDGC